MGQVIWSPTALNDLDAITEYIESCLVYSWPSPLSSGKASVNVHTSAIHMEKSS